MICDLLNNKVNITSNNVNNFSILLLKINKNQLSHVANFIFNCKGYKFWKINSSKLTRYLANNTISKNFDITGDLCVPHGKNKIDILLINVNKKNITKKTNQYTKVNKIGTNIFWKPNDENKYIAIGILLCTNNKRPTEYIQLI